jgi:flagellar biosynthesis/type III secretory pathway chaperone
MQGELAELLEVLEAQRALQTTLVGLSEQKIQTITSGNAQALHGIVDEEKEVLTQIRTVEMKQSQCVERLAALLGLPVEAICMTLIIEKARGTQKDSLKAIRKQLSDLIDKQLKYNDINMRLLQMNMDYVQFLINTVSNQQVGSTYGNGGNIQKSIGKSKNLLDRKV